MKKIKLLLISGGKAGSPGECREWNLEGCGEYTIGCRSKKAGADIELPGCKGVTPLHARFFFKDERWWLEDQENKGTRVNGTALDSGQPVVLKEYDRICLGSWTYLVVLAPGKGCVLKGRLCFIPEVADALNYALLCSGLPFIQRITIINGHKSPSRAFTLELRLGQYYQESVRVPALEAGECFQLTDFNLYPEVFSHPGYTLLFTLDRGKEAVYRKEIRKMSFNTWLKDSHPATCTSLAAFVLPRHTYVVRLADKVRSNLREGANPAPREVLKFLYNYLKDNWQIRFNEEPFCNEYNSQKVRLPQHILYDWEQKHGEGNCLDLSLLFCSCLENWGCEAVAVLLELGPELWHALVGILPPEGGSRVPLVKAKEELPRDLFLLDPNGLSSHMDFEAAVRQARELYSAHSLLFALRILDARDYGITPLPFEGTPKESPLVIELDIKARELAESINAAYRVCTTLHLLLALLQEGAGLTEKVFLDTGVDPQKAAAHFIQGLQNIEIRQSVEKLAFSRNYALVMPRAALLARETKSLFIMEEHLLLALLEIPGESLNMALQELGLDRRLLKTTLSSLLDDTPGFREEYAKSVYNNKKLRPFFF